MEEAAESVMSMGVEAVEPVRIGDRFGERPQGCRAAQGAVRPMLRPGDRRRVGRRSPQQGPLVAARSPERCSLYGDSLVSCPGSLVIVDLQLPAQQLELVPVETEDAGDVETMSLFWPAASPRVATASTAPGMILRCRCPSSPRWSEI
ncbi:hypothetical protein [Streptomyces sp. NPDC047009]|uniref:hypothetical protein n=1 Tax=unclassified Streptomyces TaxID=2593676 RepID=UPI0033D95BD2